MFEKLLLEDVLDISRFISHLLRVSWVAAFAQHTFCFPPHNKRRGARKQGGTKGGRGEN